MIQWLVYTWIFNFINLYFVYYGERCMLSLINWKWNNFSLINGDQRIKFHIYQKKKLIISVIKYLFIELECTQFEEKTN